MSYHFYCKGGLLHLKDEESVKRALDILEDHCINGEFYKASGSNDERSYLVYGGCDGCNYHEEDFEEFAKLCSKESYLDFLGEDDSVWSLVFKDGKMESINGCIEWKHGAPDMDWEVIGPKAVLSLIAVLYEKKLQQGKDECSADREADEDACEMTGLTIGQLGDLYDSVGFDNASAING